MAWRAVKSEGSGGSAAEVDTRARRMYSQRAPGPATRTRPLEVPVNPRSIWPLLVPLASLASAPAARAEQKYKPTVGLETESADIKIFRLAPSGTACTVHHAQEMSKSAAKSAEVPSLDLMYMNLDGVPKEGGKEGHEELILGPHTVRTPDKAGHTLADGLTAQRQWFEHSLHFCTGPAAARLKIKHAGKDVVPLDDVLKAFAPTKPAYKMEIVEGHNDGCKWYALCPAGAGIGVDTQVTYTVPLAKLTAREFGEMPRSGSQGPYVRGSAEAAIAFVTKHAPNLKADEEVRGLFQLFYKFASAAALCMDSEAASCIKNADGQMVKADLRELVTTMKARAQLRAWWEANSTAPEKGKPWREPKDDLVKAMVAEIDLTRFPDFRDLKPGMVPPDQLGEYLLADVGFVFRHHLIMVFDGNGTYKNECQGNKLKTNYGDDRYERVLCDRIAVAAETYKPIPADGGALYVIVESRFTGNPFNHAFFPCGAGVTGTGGACPAPVDFAHVPGPKAAEWTKLEGLQLLPTAMSGGAAPEPTTREEALGLVHRDEGHELPGKPFKKKVIQLGPKSKTVEVGPKKK